MCSIFLSEPQGIKIHKKYHDSSYVLTGTPESFVEGNILQSSKLHTLDSGLFFSLNGYPCIGVNIEDWGQEQIGPRDVSELFLYVWYWVSKTRRTGMKSPPIRFRVVELQRSKLTRQDDWCNSFVTDLYLWDPHPTSSSNVSEFFCLRHWPE